MIDAHVHVACADDARYPRTPTGVGSEWWRHGGRPQDLLAAMESAAVEAAVVVQAIGVYGYDCGCAADTVRTSAGRFSLVGAIDMDGPDPAEVLAEQARDTPLAGVRVFGVGAGGARWLADGRADAVWALAAELGITVVPTVFTDRLPELRAVLERHPHVTVGLDHCAFPDMAPPERRGDLLHLAELPNLHLKVTSHNLHAAGDPVAFLESLVAAFGAGRLAWGSDYPQHDSLTYPAMVDLARQACAGLAEHERAAFLGGTARRLWFTTTTTTSSS